MPARILEKPEAVDLRSVYLRLAGLEEESIVDGPGLRLTVFTQGCRHACPGCHNPRTHALDGGTLQSLAEILEIYRENPLLRGMTFSGGEPFLQAAPLVLLAGEVHCLGGDVVCYTGYYYETLRKLAASGADDVGNLLDAVDLLIDGPYIESLRNLELLFRGSSNQRILDRQAMRKLDEAGMPASV
ncbi:MAG: radical SAM protein [Desulfovibrio sp.]